jgi:6-phosphogluconolactonase
MKKNFRSGALLLIIFLLTGLGYAKHGNYIVFVGTYTKADSQGIYAYRYDAASGKMTPLGLAAKTNNPSFLTVDSRHKFLYAVNESGTFKGEASGGVTAFTIDRNTAKLTELNEVASHGADPCYISFDKSGKYVLVANYTGGTAAVFPIKADGRLAEASSVVKDAGTLGPKKDRQDAAHAHWIEASAHNRFVYVADLGLDRVLIYKFDPSKGLLTSGDSGAEMSGSSSAKDFYSAVVAPATGPRHMAFSADGKFMYVLGELDSTVTVFANDANETYGSIQKISALPAGFSGPNDAAEIVIHPAGKFLYTSNRGDDSIALFMVDRGTGKLTFVERVASGGKTPRNFAIDPAGSRLLAANEESGNIVEFTIDAHTGKLTAQGEVAKVGSPVCLVFMAED